MNHDNLNRLEIMALQKVLDNATWDLIRTGKEDKTKYTLRIMRIERYKVLTGQDYVYQDVER
jgi:hypothetical protein